MRTSNVARASRDPGREAWDTLSTLLGRLRSRHAALAAELDLAPMQAWALKHLQPGAPLPMSALADALGCDASNVTGIVDRLEARGLIERRPAAHDRRVKMISVTQRGADLRGTLLARLHEAPPEIAGLTRADQRALRDILRRMIEPR